MIQFNDTTLFFDIETHSIDERYAMSPREYFRLGGWSWGESEEIRITEDYDEMMAQFDKATMSIAHNGHSFDWSVLFGVDSIEPVRMARKRTLFDTLIHATHVFPPPGDYFTNKDGKQVKCKKPDEARRWYSLDNLAHQLGVEGKLMKLTELADKHLYTEEPILLKSGKPGKRTKKIRIPGRCCGFGWIPTDDPDFREYLRWDVIALRNVARALLEKEGFTPYNQRIQMVAACDAQITRNGWLVNQPLVEARQYEQAETAAWILNELHDRYGVPLDSKKPLSTNEGKAALLLALADVGVREMALDRTDSGAPSFGGDSIKKACGFKKNDDGSWTPLPDANPEALQLAEAVATLAGQRTLPDLVMASLHPDGKVHPEIMPLQRSGRKSTTDPGLTIFDDNHKDYFLPDQDDHVLIEFDFSNADARALAAMSGDREFAKRFLPGQDGHMINALAIWGALTVNSDPKYWRQRAKEPGHGWGYRIGAARLSSSTGASFEEAQETLANLNKAFPGVVRWQDKMSSFGAQNGYVINDWGRKMPVDRRRAFTQSPALMGQSVTNELLGDGLIRLPERILRMVKVTVHDALAASMPKATLDNDILIVQRCFSRKWKPKQGGQTIDFPLGHGPAGRNWKEAVH